MNVFNLIRGRFGIFKNQVISIKNILRDYAHRLRNEILGRIKFIDLYQRIETEAKSLGLQPLY